MIFKNVNLFSFFLFLTVVSCVPLTNSLPTEQTNQSGVLQVKGYFIFDLNAYIHTYLKTCDIHQTHTGKL